MSPPPHGRTRRVDLVRLREKLPASVADVLRKYERHLTLERDLSPHTVRAYLDVLEREGWIFVVSGREFAASGKR